MSDDDLTFASAYVGPGGVRIHYARCEPCMYGAHPGGKHDWAGPEDIAFAAANDHPDPSGKPCACHCADGPPIEPEPFDEESLDAPPCSVCGEAGACDYDADGRPLIHADHDEYHDTEEPPC